MKPYSIDLREKVMAALEDVGSSDVVGERFGIEGSAIRKWRLRVKAGGGLEPRKPPGRAREFTAEHDAKLKEAVEQKPDATRAELAREVAEKVGRVFSKPVITRALQRLGFTRKKRHSPPPSANGQTSKRRAKHGSRTRSSNSSND